jgi:uncharacterized membrane-anchored protein YitT (DUF2179 family)
MKKNLRGLIAEYMLIVFGTFLVAGGVYFFLVPENLAAGGVSGLGIVLSSYFPNLPISIIVTILNIILLIVGFLFIGKSFGAKTVFATFVFSGAMGLMELMYPDIEPLTSQILLNLIMGICIAGLGLSIVFNQNASTGGTDIIAKIFNHYFNIDMGKSLLFADVFIVTGALFTFGMETGLLAIFGLFLNSIVVDYFIDGFKIRKEVMVISKEPDKIRMLIIRELNRGATVYKVEGAYTGSEQKAIVTVIGKREYVRLKKKVAEVDSQAFLIVRNVHEVLGEGFENLANK